MNDNTGPGARTDNRGEQTHSEVVDEPGELLQLGAGLRSAAGMLDSLCQVDETQVASLRVDEDVVGRDVVVDEPDFVKPAEVVVELLPAKR